VGEEKVDDASKRPTSSGLRNGIILLVIILAILIAYRFCVPAAPGSSPTVPVEFSGTWVTSEPGHSDWYVRITPDSITLGTGAIAGKRYHVTGYDRVSREGGDELHIIYFKDVDRARLSKEFRHNTEGRESLVFTDQPNIVWVRQQ
jgi:hypothetical protein